MKETLSRWRRKLVGEEYDDGEYYDDGDDEFIEDEYEDDYQDDYRSSSKYGKRGYERSSGTRSSSTRERDRERSTVRHKNPTYDNVVNMPRLSRDNAGSNVSICKPISVEEARDVSDLLQNHTICVVNLSGLEKANSQRIADFISGTSHALGCEIELITDGIFVVAPMGVKISASMREELRSPSGMLSWMKSK